MSWFLGFEQANGEAEFEQTNVDKDEYTHTSNTGLEEK